MDKRTILFLLCVTLAFFAIQVWFGKEKGEKPIPVTSVTSVAKMPAVSQRQDEKFYTLENEYQQLVFSNLGGSLAEINLPLKSEKDPQSYVNEIDFDRIIEKENPESARFPLKTGKVGGYYPFLRRNIAPEYYALQITGDTITPFEVTRVEKNLIEFRGTVGGASVIKTYSIPEERNGPYCFELDIRIDGNPTNLWLQSGVPDVEIVSNAYTPLLRVQVTRNGQSEVNTIDLPKKNNVEMAAIAPNWMSNSNGFFGMIVDPKKTNAPGFRAIQIPGEKVPTRLSLIDAAYNRYPPKDYPGYMTFLPLQNGTSAFRIFAGPYDTSLLKELDGLYEEPATHYNPDYVDALSIQGWFSFISQPFSKFLFFLMQIFYAVTRSWAAAIILLTIALRAMMYPLNNWSIRSSVKMQELAPKVKAVQEKYKKEPRKAQMEVMNLYKQSGVNPLTGCLPMLLQMPFLIGMFYMLKSYFPLRGALFIPGWIDDLSAPDILFTWNQPLWFIGNEFHLLPILMGVTMYLQQKLTATTPKDASQLSDAQKQQKMMGNMMAILFTVMFYNFPSGLNLYFMLSTLLGIAQQMWMTKKMKVARA